MAKTLATEIKRVRWDDDVRIIDRYYGGDYGSSERIVCIRAHLIKSYPDPIRAFEPYYDDIGEHYGGPGQSFQRAAHITDSNDRWVTAEQSFGWDV